MVKLRMATKEYVIDIVGDEHDEQIDNIGCHLGIQPHEAGDRVDRGHSVCASVPG